MEYSKKEILDALKIIQKTCEKQTSCFVCPFADVEGNGICKIMDNSPDEWYVVGTESEIWRAFI